MAEKRKDNRGRNLRDGEDQMPDGRYRYRYTDFDGKRQAVYSWRLVPTDEVPAGKRVNMSLRDREKVIESDLRDGIDGRNARKVTLNEMFEIYISGKNDLKASTRNNYKYMYTNYVAKDIGQKKLVDIRYSHIRTFYNSLVNERGFKPNSMGVIHTILHPVFTLAVRDGYLRANPADGALAEIKKSHDWEKGKRHALTEEEQSALMAFVSQSSAYRRWIPLLTFFLGTGCRVGETIGLRWEDCDFEEGMIRINHNLTYRQQDNGKCEMHITTPKTSAGCRTIPMLNEVRSALEQERHRQQEEGGCKAVIDGYENFVFCNKYGYIYNPQTINRTLERIRRECNEKEAQQAQMEGRKPLVIRHFSVHNLRHTFCTRFCEHESNVKVIQEIMGHSDISVTMNIYAEATENKKKESFANLQGKIKIS